MKKLVLFVGVGIGFIVGSWAGRGPYERLKSAVRDVKRRRQVQSTLQSAAESAAAVRDPTRNAMREGIDEATNAAAWAIDQTSKKISNEAPQVASNVSASPAPSITRKELYEEAREAGIAGRSSMSKVELQQALNE